MPRGRAGCRAWRRRDRPILSPARKTAASRGLSGLLRWLLPGFPEVSVFFWLFLLGTGWNFSTACAVDATDPEGWAQPHPQSEKFSVIHAFKNRAGRHQFAISLTKPEWHPFRILQYVIARTAPLRNEVRRRLARLRAKQRSTHEVDIGLLAEIQRHEALLRTPWLYFSGKTDGRIDGLVSDGASANVTHIARAVIEAHGLADHHPRLLKIVTSDARHTWIGHAYVQSNYHVLLTQLASQHASARTLKHYLRSRRYRAHSEDQVRKLQDALFAEIGEKRVLDATRLRLLVEHGRITPEQERRLGDVRQRTRLGMGCLDPKSPPRSVAPDHQEGKLCRVQRCTGCANGIVFPESMPSLARAYSELLHLRRSMSLLAWEGSSFADEYRIRRRDAAQLRCRRCRGGSRSLDRKAQSRRDRRPWHLSELLNGPCLRRLFRAPRNGGKSRFASIGDYDTLASRAWSEVRRIEIFPACRLDAPLINPPATWVPRGSLERAVTYGITPAKAGIPKNAGAAEVRDKSVRRALLALWLPQAPVGTVRQPKVSTWIRRAGELLRIARWQFETSPSEDGSVFARITMQDLLVGFFPTLEANEDTRESYARVLNILVDAGERGRISDWPQLFGRNATFPACSRWRRPEGTFPKSRPPQRPPPSRSRLSATTSSAR